MLVNKIKKFILNDYIFSIFIKVLVLVVGILHSAFLARFLGAELKGIAATITSSVALIQVILTCGIHQAYPYYKRKGEDKNFLSVFINNVYFIYLSLFITTVILLVCLRNLPFKIISIILLTPIFAYETIVSYIYLIEHPKKKNIWTFTSVVAETVLVVLLWLVFKPNHPLMIIVISFAVLVRAITSTIGLKVKLQANLFSFHFIFKMVKFGSLPMMALVLTVMNSKVDILMMGMHSDITNISIGLYSVGVGVADKILAIPDAVREILLSKLVFGKNEEEVARVTRMSVWICIIMATSMTLLGKPIIRILYGKEYIGAYRVLAISAFGTVFMVFLKMISQYNIVSKRQMANLIMLTVSVITNIVLNIILIPKFQIEGAAMASFVGHLVCAICFITYFCNRTKTNIKTVILPQKEDYDMILGLLNFKH